MIGSRLYRENLSKVTKAIVPIGSKGGVFIQLIDPSDKNGGPLMSCPLKDFFFHIMLYM